MLLLALHARFSQWILGAGLWAVTVSVTGAGPGVPQLGRQPFTDSRDPPSYREVADDCSAQETDCMAQPNGGHPEVSDEFLNAVVAFQQRIAVPASSRNSAGVSGMPGMQKVFRGLGCADCHRPTLPVVIDDGNAARRPGTIAPYTDLLLHDLGSGLADVKVSGRAEHSRWRTAPLWGIGYRTRSGAAPTLLHDGRARSIEEAILWHHGEAQRSREKFESLGASTRRTLIDWIATL